MSFVLTVRNMSEKQFGSIYQIKPIFSFPVENGQRAGGIYVYLVRSRAAKFAIITFGDSSSERAYAVQTITSNTEFEELVLKAAKEWGGEDNPFKELLSETEAMKILAKILAL